MPPQANQALRAEKAETEAEPTQRNPEKATASEKITADFLETLQTYTENLCLLMAVAAAAVQNTVTEQVRAEEERSIIYLVENILQSAVAAAAVPTLETQNQPKASLLVETEEMAVAAAAELADAEAEIIHGILPEALVAPAPTAETARTAFC